EISTTVLAEYLQNAVTAHLFGPRPWPRPCLGACFDRIRAAPKHHSCHFLAAPAARPPQGRALQDIVAHIRVSPSVKKRQRKRRRLILCHVLAWQRPRVAPSAQSP